MWMSESARIASRSELRETSRRAARSLSFGRRSPGLNSPELIISRIFARASSVTLTVLLGVQTSNVRCRTKSCTDGGRLIYWPHVGQTSYVCASFHRRHRVAGDVRRPLPHVAAARRVRRDEPRSRLQIG